MKKLFVLPLVLTWSLSCLAEATVSDQETPAFKDDIVARVGDQPITFNQLSTMINSSAIVGLSIPALGTPERDQVRLTLLDKVISANLLYLDAVKQGLDKDPAYQRDLQRFSNSMLAHVYRQKYLRGANDVTEEEIREYFDNNIVAGTEYTDEVKAPIEAMLRKQRFGKGTATTRNRLREGVEVVIQEQELDSEDDAVRDNGEVMATVYGEAITWGEVKGVLSKPVNAGSLDNRREALNEIIDYRIMARKGREAGLERDPLYLARYNEFRKTRLINMHRTNLVHQMDPTEEELWAYYDMHRDTLVIPARRKVQIVVLKTKEDAAAVKQMVESGSITMYQAAAEYSILAGADKTLGELGWVREGTGFPELDALAFSLGPGKIGGPVETPNGWHLVKIQDVEDAKYDDLEDAQTARMVRRKLLKEKLNDYVVTLREKEFPVEVYDKKLSYHMQKELDWYKIKAETGTQPPEKILEDIGKLRGEPVH